MNWERIWYPAEPETLVEQLARLPLSIASLGFRAAAATRGALYDAGVLPSRRVQHASVISVGNLTVGGAGKTPVVIHLAERFSSKGHEVAVLSRGYGRRSTEPLAFDAASLPSAELAGDEPVLIAQRCHRVRVYVGADRVERAEAAVRAGAEILLLDDGLQHRRLRRDADVVVVDEAVGFGNGALLPRGPLREPPTALRRASLLWLRASATPASSVPPFDGPIVRAAHRPKSVVDPDGVTNPAESLSGRKVWALCALARPGSFERSLQGLGASVVGHTFAPDHHAWTRPEIEQAARDASSAGAVVVTTEKDRVKMPRDVKVHVLRLEVDVLTGGEHLDALLGARRQPG